MSAGNSIMDLNRSTLKEQKQKDLYLAKAQYLMSVKIVKGQKLNSSAEAYHCLITPEISLDDVRVFMEELNFENAARRMMGLHLLSSLLSLRENLTDYGQS